MSFINQTYRGKNQFFRWTVVLLLLFYPFYKGVYYLLFNYETLEKAYVGMSNFQRDRNEPLVKGILTNIPYLLLMYLLVKFVLKRSFLSIINTQKRLRLEKLFFGYFSFGVMAVFALLISFFLAPSTFVLNNIDESFYYLLLIAFFLIPIKVCFDELLFRGLLLQFFGYLTKKKWLAIVLSSLVFAFLMSGNPDITVLKGYLFVFLFFNGLTAAIITVLDDGIELTIATHSINNAIAVSMITNRWSSFQTDALFTSNITEPDIFLSIILPVLILNPLYIIVLRYLFNWNDWKNKIFGSL